MKDYKSAIDCWNNYAVNICNVKETLASPGESISGLLISGCIKKAKSFNKRIVESMTELGIVSK